MVGILSLCFSYLISSFHLSRRSVFRGLFCVASHKVCVWKKYLAIEVQIHKSFHLDFEVHLYLYLPHWTFQVCYLWSTQKEGSLFVINLNSS